MEPRTIFLCGTLMPPIIGPLINRGITGAWKGALVKTLPRLGTAGCEETYQGMARWLKSKVSPEEPLTLVGQSQGGLYAVLLALDLPNPVERVVTLSAPHHGSNLSYAAPVIAPFCYGLWDMRPTSRFMKSYMDRLPEISPRLTSVYAHNDLVIHPSNSSHVDGACNYIFASLKEYGATHAQIYDTTRLDGNPTHFSELFDGDVAKVLRFISASGGIIAA